MRVVISTQKLIGHLVGQFVEQHLANGHPAMVQDQPAAEGHDPTLTVPLGPPFLKVTQFEGRQEETVSKRRGQKTHGISPLTDQSVKDTSFQFLLGFGKFLHDIFTRLPKTTRIPPRGRYRPCRPDRGVQPSRTPRGSGAGT
jgi:hypothetical protein